ncbi:MarR family winged helix-turn-helix transcriptional regulator [Nitrospina gracilis]|uniref:MarR family winged helix-turn-helix transcriptional regulator n=1 Tax=Nitrospina gracilis TaxID=35801 RepID=UPI001F271867|nr:MarR family winged helix-turn-helix transcriptional regulator [Nitrospina gracilis]MCF8721791.1 DNA-binding MarR family transcriptional regulator [Nitrospina gracilis Nb-211]
MSASLLHDYIERISHLIRSETRIAGTDFDLQPIQLDVLHYLTRSNRYSNTPQGVTDYFGLTKGTVSQTIKALESKGLLSKTPDAKDGRKVHLAVTRTGKKLLDKTMPARVVAGAWEELPEEDRDRLIAHLSQLLAKMQKANGMNAFGVCRTCRFNSQISDTKFFCELTQEPLSATDVTLLCREHTVPTEEAEPAER